MTLPVGDVSDAGFVETFGEGVALVQLHEVKL